MQDAPDLPTWFDASGVIGFVAGAAFTTVAGQIAAYWKEKRKARIDKKLEAARGVARAVLEFRFAFLDATNEMLTQSGSDRVPVCQERADGIRTAVAAWELASPSGPDLNASVAIGNQAVAHLRGLAQLASNGAFDVFAVLADQRQITQRLDIEATRVGQLVERLS